MWPFFTLMFAAGNYVSLTLCDTTRTMVCIQQTYPVAHDWQRIVTALLLAQHGILRIASLLGFLVCFAVYLPCLVEIKLLF